MVAIREYIRVQSLAEALRELQKTGGGHRVLAGGTDILLKGGGQTSGEPLALVDISDAPDLNGIEFSTRGLRIGAAARLSAIAHHDKIIQFYPPLAQGALAVGSPQIRNTATLGGNLCNAAPSADTAAPLLALDAVMEVDSPTEKRAFPLEKFFGGPGKTVLGENEILTAVLVHLPAPGAVGVYLKHSPRQALDLAVVGVAVMLWYIRLRLHVRIALSAVAPTPIRARKAEQFVEDRGILDEGTILGAAAIAAQEASPINDLRASADYRREMVRVLVARALHLQPERR